MDLTEHFTLQEFEHSAIAQELEIDNRMPPQYIPAALNLCRKVLEPLRQHFDCPVVINSGYRCPELNRAVGGVRNSQHQTGQAADIPFTNGWMEWIADNTDFDQLILESSGDNRWIHVSCCPEPYLNRYQVFRSQQ